MNLYIQQGTDFTHVFNARQGSDFLDLSDAFVEGSLKKNFDSIFSASFTAEITNPLNGEVRLSLSETQTASLDSTKNYVFDVYATINGQTKRILGGIAYIDRAVTLPSDVPQVPLPNYRFDIQGYPEYTGELDGNEYLLLSKDSFMYKIKLSNLLGG